MLLVLACIYLLLHPYLGLIHDSRIYTLQALNRLNPDLYSGDVFLKFGSQDSYTLFSPIYAGLIQLFDTELAARLLALVANLAVLWGAWRLAREIMPRTLSYAAVGVLLVIPGYYGPDEFFSVLEGFVTPRQLAEALVLCGISAWLLGRRLLCIALLAIAMCFHPIMAMPGLLLTLLLVLLPAAVKHWRWLCLFAIPLVPAMAAAAAGWLPLTPWQFDSAWWPMVGRESLLLLTEWTTADWARLATVLVTLIAGALVLESHAARLAFGTLLISCAALFLSWIGGDVLRIIIIVQGQPWRALWLATTVAALLMPLLFSACRNGPVLHRVAALLLAASWIAGHQALAFAFSIPALLAMIYARFSVPFPCERGAELVAIATLGIVLLCTFSLTISDVEIPSTSESLADWIDTARRASADGILPFTLLLGTWWLTANLPAISTRVAVAVAVIFPTTGLAADAVSRWQENQYPPEAFEAFAGWRELIPQREEVLWATDLIRGSDPLTVWLLLQRPNYYSSVQVNSALFSRRAAVELQQRYRMLPQSLPVEQTLRIVYSQSGSSTGLRCNDLPTRFTITHVPIADATMYVAPAYAPHPFDSLKLAVCQ